MDPAPGQPPTLKSGLLSIISENEMTSTKRTALATKKIAVISVVQNYLQEEFPNVAIVEVGGVGKSVETQNSDLDLLILLPNLPLPCTDTIEQIQIALNNEMGAGGRLEGGSPPVKKNHFRAGIRFVKEEQTLELDLVPARFWDENNMVNGWTNLELSTFLPLPTQQFTNSRPLINEGRYDDWWISSSLQIDSCLIVRQMSQIKKKLIVLSKLFAKTLNGFQQNTPHRSVTTILESLMIMAIRDSHLQEDQENFFVYTFYDFLNLCSEITSIVCNLENPLYYAYENIPPVIRGKEAFILNSVNYALDMGKEDYFSKASKHYVEVSARQFLVKIGKWCADPLRNVAGLRSIFNPPNP